MNPVDVTFTIVCFSFGILPLETPSPNEAKQCIPFITPSPMALTETNVDSKAPRKVKIIWLHQEIKDVY